MTGNEIILIIYFVDYHQVSEVLLSLDILKEKIYIYSYLPGPVSLLQAYMCSYIH